MLAGCSSSVPRPDPPPVAGAANQGTIAAVTHHDGTLYVARNSAEGCVIESYGEQGNGSPLIEAVLPGCPDRIRLSRDGKFVLESNLGVSILVEDSSGETRAAQATESNYVELAGETLSWFRDGNTATASGRWTGKAEILDREGAVVAVREQTDGERLVRLSWPEHGERLVETVLTGPLDEIAAIEPDADQKELALTVMRDGSYDIAIVNAEEPIMNWVPSDPADELHPRWSPVGYKLSFIVRNGGGDILRTVHVPTAAMVFLDFPDSAIIGYDWLPDGERVVVAVTSLQASDHVVEASYSGPSKTTIVAPLTRFDRQVERLPGTPAGTALVMPTSIRYGVQYPLIVWVAGPTRGGSPFRSELVPLLRRDSIALVVVNGRADDLDQSFWDALAETRWVDTGRVWIVADGDEDHVIPEFVQRLDRPADLATAMWLEEQIEEGRREP